MGASKITRSGSSTSKAPRTRETSWVASREWPPSSKKLSWAPTRVETQQIGPQTGEPLLHRSARRGGPGGLPLRRRQRPPVDLAVGGERQRRQLDEGGRHHVVGEPGGEERPQPAGEIRRRAGLGDHVGREVAVPPLLADHHHRLPDPFQAADRRLDLPRLDAEAADLDLLVRPAGEDRLAVGQVAAEVAGAVDAVRLARR